MRAAERAVFDAGTPEYELMERAGRAVADIVWRVGGVADTLVLCGPGNNGGDGYVIARALAESGVPVRVAALTEPRTPSAKTARAGWDGPVEPLADARPATQVVDALFGTGLTRGLDEAVAGQLGTLVAAARRSYAVDLPSGVETDTGACLSPVPRFSVCVALGAWKPAHLLQPAAGRFGRGVLAEIGIDTDGAQARRLDAPTLAAPGVEAHKYSRGLVAVVAGAMPGAAALAAEAAARGGAGYVRLLTEDRGVAISHAIVRSEAADFAKAKAALVGPGLGRDDAARERLAGALKSGVPVVADADALWLMGETDLPAPAIVTPHEGEFVRLFGDLPGGKIARALAAAKSAQAVVVYKGPDTVIAAPDGRAAVAGGASPWLSTAGTGDVLAGLCAARLAVTGDPFRAACEAVWLHGEAARRADAAFVADQLIAQIPAAIGSRL